MVFRWWASRAKVEFAAKASLLSGNSGNSGNSGKPIKAGSELRSFRRFDFTSNFLCIEPAQQHDGD